MLHAHHLLHAMLHFFHSLLLALVGIGVIGRIFAISAFTGGAFLYSLGGDDEWLVLDDVGHDALPHLLAIVDGICA